VDLFGGPKGGISRLSRRLGPSVLEQPFSLLHCGRIQGDGLEIPAKQVKQVLAPLRPHADYAAHAGSEQVLLDFPNFRHIGGIWLPVVDNPGNTGKSRLKPADRLFNIRKEGADPIPLNPSEIEIEPVFDQVDPDAYHTGIAPCNAATSVDRLKLSGF
jgi:hypothetical protein